MWSLRKWYLDCVADDGTTWIGYWGWLRFGPIRLSFASSMLGGTTATTIRRVKEPREDDGVVVWDARRLGVRAALVPRTPPVTLSLHPSVRWRCVAPSADVTVNIGARTIRGRGYAEVLEIAMAPWRLPIRELRWGRAIGERSSLVWIRWDGASPLRILVLDGIVQADEEPSLALSDDAVLRSERLGDTLRAIPLGRLLPRRLTDAHEQKWRSRGAMHSADGSIDHGWVIHELVTFPAA